MMSPYRGVFTQPVHPSDGCPVSPLAPGNWPGGREGPLYWMARRTFSLPGAPEAASLSVVVDRHYEIFINGTRIALHRGYFSGDRYLLLQHHADPAIAAACVAGENRIEVLVRSDPFGNKNYVRFHPLLWLEGAFSGPHGKSTLATGADWEVAAIDNGRAFRLLQTTIVHETVNLFPDDACGPRGTPPDLAWKKPFLPDPAGMPPVFAWTERPRRVDTHRPGRILFSGRWDGNSESLCFNLADLFQDGQKGATLRGVFSSAVPAPLQVAVSRHCSCSLEVNGQTVAERDSLPQPDLRKQRQNGLAPWCEVGADAGDNELVFRFNDEHRRFLDLQQRYASNPGAAAGLWFRLQVHGVDANAWRWTNGAGRPVTPTPLTGPLHDILSAKHTAMPLAQLSAGDPPSSFAIRDADPSRNPFVMLDFNGIKRGRLSFRVRAASAGRIYVCHGFMAAMGSVDCDRFKAIDILNVPAGTSCFESFEDRTFVFVDLAFEGFSGDIAVDRIEVEERVFLDERNAAFESDDTVMNAIWRASIRTAQICCDEIYMDNAEREHAQWLCSALPNIAAGYYAFGGNGERAAKVLTEYAMHQKANGEIQGYAPGLWGAPDRPAYQCHVGLYFRAVWRHYQFTGNRELLGWIMPRLERVLDFWAGYRNSEGLLENVRTVWVDWGVHMYDYAPNNCGGCGFEPGPGGIFTAMNGYYLGALRMSAELAAEVGAAALAGQCAAQAEETARAMARRLYDPARGLFRDGVNHALAERNYSQQANAVCALYGVFQPEQGTAILRAAFEDSEPWRDIIPASPHFGLLTGEALFEGGLDETAWHWIRKHEKMLAWPAGTIWETWTPYISHCQGPGSAIAHHLARYHAGVFPARPGFTTIGVDPRACGRSRLKASLHTAFGVIGVEWERAGTGFDYRLALPDALRDRETVAAPGVDLQRV